MRKVLFFLCLLFASRAHAATCTTLSSGASQSTIQSALNSCGSGNTVAFSAGTYGPINSTVTIPCGVSMTGPVVPYSQTHNQTAIINASGSQSGFGFQTTACNNNGSVIQYFEWNGNRSSATDGNSGGFITTNISTTSNFIIQHNWLHGVSGCNTDTSPNCGQVQSNLINLGGGNGGAVTSNVTIQYNELGSESLADCAHAMNDQQTTNGGGNCNGVGIYGSTANVSVIYNIFHWLEQGAKYYEVSLYGSNPLAYCNPFTFSYNFITEVNRIGYETQCNIGTSSWPTLQYVQYNAIGNRYSGADSLFDLSIANGCGNVHGSFCVNYVDYNADIQNFNPPTQSAGFEFWGQDGSTGNYNLFEGHVAGVGGAFDISQNGYFTFNNNTFNIFSGSNTSCTAARGGYWNQEDSPAFQPISCTGNTFSNTGSGTYTSVQPTIPASQSFSTSFTVTFTNPGTNRDTSTGIWYTTDGSNPMPGTGTATFIQGGGSINITSTTTVKAVGMWGAINQPYSWPAGYGYVPSAVVSATYTGSTPVTATPVISPASTTFTLPLSVTITDSSPSPTIYYTTNGTTPTTASTVYTGAITVSGATTQVQAIATSSGLAQSPVASNTYTYVPPPTLTGCFQSNTTNAPPFTPFVNTLNVGQSVTQHLQCRYSSGPSPLDCTTTDANGSAVSFWGALDPTKLSVGAVGSGSPGLVTALAAGSTNVTANAYQPATGTTEPCSQWTFTVSAPPAAPTNMQVIVISENGVPQ